MSVPDDLFRGVGVEITLPTPDSFLKIKETLTRVGVASKTTNTLYQSCHILHKQGRYAIVHFKELFQLDGKAESLSDEDKARRNTIVKLLVQWNLVGLADSEQDLEPVAALSLIKVLPFAEKAEWSLVPKYTVGRKKT